MAGGFVCGVVEGKCVQSTSLPTSQVETAANSFAGPVTEYLRSEGEPVQRLGQALHFQSVSSWVGEICTEKSPSELQFKRTYQ